MMSLPFSGFEKCFEQNLFFYRLYLGSEGPLSPLGVLHLKGLRYLIDLRLQDLNAVYQDSNDIFDITDGDQYLHDEFSKKYSPYRRH